MSGSLIAIEGIDGSGKTTIATRLASTLRDRGYEVVLTREPGGTRVGEGIRRLLLDGTEVGVLPETEALLFAASRAQLVGEVIGPALASGAIVITDRFVDSSLAYQSGGRGLDIDRLRAAQGIATHGLEADLKILLDIDAQSGLLRRHSESGQVNRLDREDLAFYNRVRQAYRKLATADPGRWRIVVADAEPEHVWCSVWNAVEELLNRAKNSPIRSQLSAGTHP